MRWSKLQHKQWEQLQHLFDTCDPYLEPVSISQDWYESLSMGNLESLKNWMQIDTFPAYQIFDFLVSYYGNRITISERSSRRSGYIPEQNMNGQVVLLLPYRGRFGAGWIVATHYSNTSVNCKYCLLYDGGLNHGKEKEETCINC